MIAMGELFARLEDEGFELRQVNNSLRDDASGLPLGPWRDTPGPWATLPPFPRRRGVANHTLLESRRDAVLRLRRKPRPLIQIDAQLLFHCQAMTMNKSR